MAKLHVVKNINQTGQNICVVCQENVHEFLGGRFRGSRV